MISHIRSNLLLLGLTVLSCCVVYPAILFAIGQTVFHDKAEGSLIYSQDGQAIGSRLIAQPFTGEGYFHPRPSAAGYNGAASGASNWGANNPNLRKRVVAAIGPLLKYRDGRPVGPDIVAWVRESLSNDRAILNEWVASDPYLAERWGAANADFLKAWGEQHPDEVTKWRSENGDAEITSRGLAGLFFTSYATNKTPDWPETNGADLQVAFFELWWAGHSTADVEPVPADMVMASGSGLDPHITLKAALYQLDRVAASRAATAKKDPAAVRKEIQALILQHSSAPLGGYVGNKIVNVLEINLELQSRYKESPLRIPSKPQL